MKLSPIYKGTITGIAMLGLTLAFYYSNVPSDSGLQYCVYALYAAGIAWTLFAYVRSPNYKGKFADIFGQGFRCFIVITLIMVIFTAAFSMTHPEFAEQDSKIYREYLEKEEKNKTPAEKDEMAENLKKHYTTGLVSSAIFGHLILGTVFTAAGAGLILIRRKT